MIYLDSAATGKPYPEAVEKFVDMCQNTYGNSSSLHSFGLAAENEVNAARKVIAKALGATSAEIYFTSGGTESNNIALFGAARALKRRGNKIIASAYEHSAVYNCCEGLKNEGFNPVYIGTKDGQFDLDAFEKELDDKTVLVSVMTVNNETGLINPLSKIRQIMDKKSSTALLHTDGVQAFCKIPVNVEAVDMLTLSAHKFGGLKGSGALYIKKGVRILSPVFGGGHESGIRSGTVNSPAVAAMGVACELSLKNMSENINKVEKIKEYLTQKLLSLSLAKVHSFPQSSPYILSVSIMGIRGETLLHFLSEKDIFVATAAACASHKKQDNRVLSAQGYSDEEIASTLRISLDYDTTEEDIDKFMAALCEGVAILSRGVR